MTCFAHPAGVQRAALLSGMRRNDDRDLFRAAFIECFFIFVSFRGFCGNSEILTINSIRKTGNKKAGRRPAFWMAWLQRVRCCEYAG
jgi:hypothetical protein